MTTTTAPICFSCIHFDSDRKCAAFQDGIPDAIWWMSHDHREPFDGDGGILFEQDPEKDPLPPDRELFPTPVRG